MNTVVTITEPGSNDVLRVESRAVEKPAAGQLLIRQEAIGVNFIDIYHRKGIYPLPAYPAIPGVEGAGVVEAVGEGVEGWSAGDRVAYTGVVGAYAERRLIPAARALHLPDAISAKAAAASLLSAMTVHMLTTQTWPVGPGMTVLVPAAAGGLGSLIVRQAKRLGATVIATVGSPEKEAATRADGADHVIIGRDADIAAEVKRLTDGRGVDVAYDGVGGTMLARAIASVRPFGAVASIGQAGGSPPAVSVDALRPGKSLSAPSIVAYVAEPARYAEAARAAFAMIEAGISAHIAVERPLVEAASVLGELESGRLTGSALLIP